MTQRLDNVWELPTDRLVLVEAAAGTGKTWTIVALYLRLLLELEQPVEKILVVTFTKAACAELRERIRQRLFTTAQLLQVQLQGESEDLNNQQNLVSQDPWLMGLLQRFSDFAAQQKARHRLKLALRDFDRAAIYTIHGFCQRLLQEFALETNTPLHLNLAGQEADGPLSQQPVRDNTDWPALTADFWRRMQQEADPAWQGWLVQQGHNPQNWLQSIRPYLAYPQLRWVTPPFKLTEFQEATVNLEAVWLRAAKLWCDEDVRQEFLLSLLEAAGQGVLHGSYYRFLKPAVEQDPRDFLQQVVCTSSWYRQCNQWFSGGFLLAIAQGWPSKLGKFAQTALAAATNKNQKTPQNRFFTGVTELELAWIDWQRQSEQYWLVWTQRLWEQGRAVLPRARQASGIFHFDDLLLRVAEALGCSSLAASDPDENVAPSLISERSSHLLRQIREHYAAALIDEFQDTDALQYAIFHKIFVESAPQSAGPLSLPLYLVGDPKQAIYAFRGGDIVTYWRAQQEARESWTLTVNYRATPLLLAALNALWNPLRHSLPFVFAEIEYHLAEPKPIETERLVVTEHPEPLQWLFLSGELTREAATEQSIALLVAEIKKLIQPSFFQAGGQGQKINYWQKIDQGQQSLMDKVEEAEQAEQAKAAESIDLRALTAGDCAMLVATHEQGRKVAAALSAAGIPWVRQGVESVYSTEEASDFYLILQAIALPEDWALLRAALSTRLIGSSLEEIHALSHLENDPQRQDQWANITSQFREWQRSFYQHGFLWMFEEWLRDTETVPRLLQRVDGERRLTNVRHLAELLHLAAQHCASLEALVVWLGKVLQNPDRQLGEAALLRLETDAAAVQIVTIHASKGLQYPVVFCPFLWSDSPPDETAIFGHDEDGVPTVDWTQNNPWFVQQARKEWFAERLRLLYVALTRAQHRCYLVWGAVRLPEPSKASSSKTAVKEGAALSTEKNPEKLGVGLHTTALAWLLHPPAAAILAALPSEPWEPMQILRARLQEMTAEEVLADVRRLAEEVPQTMAVRQGSEILLEGSLPSETFDSDLVTGNQVKPAIKHFALPKRLSGEIPAISRGFAMHSYTALQSRTLKTNVEVAPVPSSRKVNDLTLISSIHQLPSGRATGLAIHEVLAKLSQTREIKRGLAQLPAWLHAAFRRYDLADAYVALAQKQIEMAFSIELPGLGKTLQDFSRQQRWAELEFTLAIPEVRSRDLRAISQDQTTEISSLERAALQAWAENPSLAAGYLVGAIDLVVQKDSQFWLIDWKTNWLGDTEAFYTPEFLAAEMAREYYALQYLLYTVALHRRLQWYPGYDYQQHFGGVFYLFWRGLSLSAGSSLVQQSHEHSPELEISKAVPPANCGSGIWFSRPAYRLVQQLDELLCK